MGSTRMAFNKDSLFKAFVGGLLLTILLCVSAPSFTRKANNIYKQVIQQRAIPDPTAKELLKSVKLACWIMTHPGNIEEKAVVVNKTWGPRCDKLVFMSSKSDKSRGIVGLPVGEGRQHLTAKTMHAFKYMHDHYGDQYDWFLKADDDTYVVVENLKELLMGFSPQQPMYFGHRFNMIVKGGYFSGGAGYVLSREALSRFSTRGFQNRTNCKQDGGDEDVEMGQCMHKLGVKLGVSEDSKGRSRFHCFQPTEHIKGAWVKQLSWYATAYGNKKGINSMSDHPISFHYINPHMMYALEYFIYRVRYFNQTTLLEHKPNIDSFYKK